ncbi:MAG TPA: hypothetical protein DHW78_10685 [Ruminococcaceae bacterium]|nr:hypothetical protein [Oscillospiraceae bacterium]
MQSTGKRFLAVLAAAIMTGSGMMISAFAADGDVPCTFQKSQISVYQMTFPTAGVGYTAKATGSRVVAGSSFELQVTLKKGFQQHVPSVCANHVQLSPVEKDSLLHTYTYVMPEVYAAADFTISAVADTPIDSEKGTMQPQPEGNNNFPVHYSGEAVSSLTGTQSLACGGLLTFQVYSKSAPQHVTCGNGLVGSVNAPVKPWDAKTQTSIWQVYGVSASGRKSDKAGIYVQIDNSEVNLFTVQLKKAPFVCDTTKDITIPSGRSYWARVTVAEGAKVSYSAGNAAVAATLVKNNDRQTDFDSGKDTYYFGFKAKMHGKTGIYLSVNNMTYCMYHVCVK